MHLLFVRRLRSFGSLRRVLKRIIWLIYTFRSVCSAHTSHCSGAFTSYKGIDGSIANNAQSYQLHQAEPERPLFLSTKFACAYLPNTTSTTRCIHQWIPMILHRTFFQTYRTIAYNNSLEFQFQIEYRHKDIFEHYLEQIRLHSVGNAEWPLYNKIAGNAHARTIDLNLALFLVAMFGKRARFSQSFHSYFGETI